MQLEEDFARWRDDPITRLVFRALDAALAQQKAQWDAASWDGGMRRADELKDLLLELRVRADAYRALGEMTPGDIRTWLGLSDER